jgi:hypothetical protein
MQAELLSTETEHISTEVVLLSTIKLEKVIRTAPAVMCLPLALRRKRRKLG